MQDTQVFEGHDLKRDPPALPTAGSRCLLPGTDSTGREVAIPFDDDLLSRHGDNNWSSPTSAEQSYQLTAGSSSTTPPAGPAISQVILSPSGGVQVGQTVGIHIKVETSNPGAIRIFAPCGSVAHFEHTVPEYDTTWNTSGCGQGTQTVRVCARHVNDPNWQSATCTERSYSLSSPPPEAPTADFWADSTTIQQGQCTVLHWTTGNATSVDIDGTSVDRSGSMRVCPTVTKHYSLKAVGSGGEATRSVSIVVSATGTTPGTSPLTSPGGPPPACEPWASGSRVCLAKGTRIYYGPTPDLNTNYHTVVPVDNWEVRVMGGSQCKYGWEWWDTSRRHVGDPSGGTGWIPVRQCSTSTAAGPAGTQPPSGSTGTQAPAGGIQLCQHINFGGRCETFNTDDSDLGNNVIGNDQASSVRVPSGSSVALYEHINFGGRCQSFGADQPSLVGTLIGNDSASSLRVRTSCGSSGVPTGGSVSAPSLVSGGAIEQKWRALGGGSGLLGRITESERPALSSPYRTTGAVAAFERGHIHWSSRHGALETHGDIDRVYSNMGGTASWLGFPIGDEHEWRGARRSDFEGGYITWDGRQYHAFRFDEAPSWADTFLASAQRKADEVLDTASAVCELVDCRAAKKLLTVLELGRWVYVSNQLSQRLQEWHDAIINYGKGSSEAQVAECRLHDNANALANEAPIIGPLFWPFFPPIACSP